MTVRSWSGVLAHVDVPTGDGRTLPATHAGAPPHRDLPLPLFVLGEETPRETVGTVNAVWLDGQDVRGQGTLELDICPTGARKRLVDGDRVPVAVTVHTPARVGAGWDGDDHGRFLDWQVAFVVLGDERSSWPDTTIALDLT